MAWQGSIRGKSAWCLARRAAPVRMARALPALVGCVLVLVASCGARTASLHIAGSDAAPVRGLGPCEDGGGGALTIDPTRPVVVLVHGCNASAGRFRALAKVFELHGQQAVCFEYDDRARVRRSARALRQSLEELASHTDDHELVVLGHSQGGLVARAALAGPALSIENPVRLVTVSSPFNGIRAASDCGSLGLHLGTLGVTVAICRMITGAKWNEIHPRARQVLEPEALSASVGEHLRVVTDERNTCRTFAADQRSCVQDDFVFSIDEQDNQRMSLDQRLRKAEVAAGHAEIVGNDQSEPRKLIDILQQYRVMSPTPENKRLALTELLRQLF
jgi:pimeloyl-ACP methyl ester carboxylesterase